MVRIFLVGFAVLVLLSGGVGAAGTIYTWTDADGVRRYSDSPPPEDVTDVETFDAEETSPGADDALRREYDVMVDEASRDADAHFREQAEKKSHEAQQARDSQDAALADMAAVEREKLQKQIDEIQSRGLGPTFSAGQKAAMIGQVQEKIDRLEADPEAYFKGAEKP